MGCTRVCRVPSANLVRSENSVVRTGFLESWRESTFAHSGHVREGGCFGEAGRVVWVAVKSVWKGDERAAKVGKKEA